MKGDLKLHRCLILLTLILIKPLYFYMSHLWNKKKPFWKWLFKQLVQQHICIYLNGSRLLCIQCYDYIDRG